MRTAVVAPLVVAALTVGLLVGRSTAVSVAPPPGGVAGIDPEARTRTWDPARRAGEPGASPSRKGFDVELDARREHRTRDVRDRETPRDDPRSTSEPIEATDGGSIDEIEALTRELVALRREHAELRDEHTELVGEPLPQPKSRTSAAVRRSESASPRSSPSRSRSSAPFRSHCSTTASCAPCSRISGSRRPTSFRQGSCRTRRLPAIW